MNMTELSFKKENPVQNGNKELGLICTDKMFKLKIGYLQSWFALHFFNIDNVLDFKSI